MIPHFPYLGFPYYNRYSRYGYRYPYYTYYNGSTSDKNDNFKKYNHSTKNDYCNEHNKNTVNHNCQKNCTKSKNDSYKDCNDNCKTSSFTDFTKKDSSCDDDSSPIFQLFGINLYFDDILIICLIWFLYNEGVKDQELFISLILLLLS